VQTCALPISNDGVVEPRRLDQLLCPSLGLAVRILLQTVVTHGDRAGENHSRYAGLTRGRKQRLRAAYVDPVELLVSRGTGRRSEMKNRIDTLQMVRKGSRLDQIACHGHEFATPGPRAQALDPPGEAYDGPRLAGRQTIEHRASDESGAARQKNLLRRDH